MHACTFGYTLSLRTFKQDCPAQITLRANEDGTALQVKSVSCEHRCKLSQHEKFYKASVLASELASVTSEASHLHFERRLVPDLIKHWKNGDEVAVMKVDEGMYVHVLKCDCFDCCETSMWKHDIVFLWFLLYM